MEDKNKKGIEYKITRLLDDEEFENVNEDESISDEVIEPPKLIETTKSCKNFWCKAQYNIKYYEGDDYSKECPKCVDFDTILSGGIESGEKHYDGPRQDGMAHEVEFHFSKFKSGKGFWNK